MQCSRNTTARDRVEEVLEVDPEEEVVLQMAVEGSDVATRPVVKEVGRELHMLGAVANKDLAVTDTIFVGHEDVLTLALVRVLEIDRHGGS